MKHKIKGTRDPTFSGLRAITSVLLIGCALVASHDATLAVVSEADEKAHNYSNSSQWPTMLALSVSGVGACSAVIVGAHALLTAAHCLQADKSGEVSIEGSRHTIDCTVHPGYAGNPRLDFALCFSSKKWPIRKYERLGVAPLQHTQPLDVSLLGFGCVQTLGLDGSYGRLTVGRATMAPVPTGAAAARVSGAALCPGDGGGGAFIDVDRGIGVRQLVGVNSRGDGVRFSEVALTSAPAFVSWAKDWSQRIGASICGLDGTQNACAGGSDRTSSLPSSSSAPRDGMDVVVRATRPADSKAPEPELLFVSHDRAETVQQVVERACGPQPKAYYDYLAELIIKTPAKLGDAPTETPLAERTFVATGDVSIPRCVRNAKGQILNGVPVVPADNVNPIGKPTLMNADKFKFEDSDEIKLYANSASPSTGLEYSPMAGNLFDTYVAQDANFPGMNLPQHVYVPTAVNGAGIGQSWDMSKTTAENSSQLEPTNNQNRLAASPRYAHLGTGEALSSSAAKLVGSDRPADGFFTPNFALSDAEAGDSCKVAGGGPISNSEPYDFKALLNALEINKDVRGYTPSGSVNIFIADNGIFWEAAAPHFTQSMLRKDNDLTWDAFYARTKVLQWHHRKASHGTQVASLAFGGMQFLDLQTKSTAPRFKLYFRRIFHPRELSGLNFDPDDDAINGIANFAGSGTGGVVNMSFAYMGTVGAPRGEVLANKANVLFVFAAGNFEPNGDSQDSQLQGLLYELPEHLVYPAMFGGKDGQINVVTVGAIRKNGTLAGFSNWGSRYVDIAAPGCAVPALTYDRNNNERSIDRISGTSVAAPLVTFAAALVRQETGGETSAARLKRRLLVASDISRSLAIKGQVADGRVLNIPKAIASLFHDVIELKSETQARRGDIIFVDSATAAAYQRNQDIDIAAKAVTKLDVCRVPLGVKPGHLLKVTPDYEGEDADTDRNEKGTLFYYKVGGSQSQNPLTVPSPDTEGLYRRVCGNFPDDIKIAFHEHGAAKTQFNIYDVDQVRDIVLRETRL